MLKMELPLANVGTLKAAATPAGSPLTLKVTGSKNPFCGVTVAVQEVLPPWNTFLNPGVTVTA